MLLTSRSREILKKIIACPYPLRIKDLAEEFQVSERTVKYDLEVIRSWLKEQNAELKAQPKRGIWFSAEGATREKILSILTESDMKNVFLNQHERTESTALKLLLADEYLSLSTLAESLGISRNTMISGMQKVENFLQGWGLILERKSGTGIRLTGSEVQKRLAVEYILQSRLSGREMFEVVRAVLERDFRLDGSKLHEKLLLPPETLEHVLETVHSIMSNAQNELGIPFSDRVLIGFIIRLCLLVKRLQSHQEIDREAFEFAKYLSERNAKLFRVCQDGLNNLAEQLALCLPEEEISYVSMQIFIGSCALLKETEPDDQEQEDPVRVMRKMISKASEMLGVPLQEDAGLADNLLAHLKEKMVKFKYGVMDPNPLVSQIRRSYPEMFEVLRLICLEVFGEMEIVLTDSDIAYIVLHFQAAYERMSTLKKLKTVVLCGTGRGTARLVRAILENELKNIQVVGIYSILEIEKVLEKQEVDFVVSVLPITLPVPVLVVNPLPAKQDIEGILALTKRLRAKKAESILLPEQRTNVLHSLPVPALEGAPSEIRRLEGMTRDIIIKGFELSQIITNEFKDYLTEQGAAGLTLHLYLMLHRFVFSEPYEENNVIDSLEPEYLTKLRTRLIKILSEQNLNIPLSELNAILRYFQLRNRED